MQLSSRGKSLWEAGNICIHLGKKVRYSNLCTNVLQNYYKTQPGTCSSANLNIKFNTLSTSGVAGMKNNIIMKQIMYKM